MYTYYVLVDPNDEFPEPFYFWVDSNGYDWGPASEPSDVSWFRNLRDAQLVAEDTGLKVMACHWKLEEI